MTASLRHPASLASGKTGATRYFSATSHVIPPSRKSEQAILLPTVSNAQIQEVAEGQTQRDRAVANGALRFVSQRYSLATTAGPSQAGSWEVITPATPPSDVIPCLHRTGMPRKRKSFIRSRVGEFRGSPKDKASQSNREGRCVKCRSKRAIQRVVEGVKRRSVQKQHHPRMRETNPY